MIGKTPRITAATWVKMPRHNQALDGLRWFAFLGVFLFHANEAIFHEGHWGVQIFFVLSGFLIGRILLTARAQDGVPIRERLKIFYARRSLRIFPLYYFLLLMILLLGTVGVLKDPRFRLLPYHAFYLTNFYMFFTGERIGSHEHFWTLDVEEHFYLLAPFVLLLAPFRQIMRGIVLLLCVVPVFRVANIFWWHLPLFEYLSPMQFDILAIGVAAAIIEQKGAFLRVTPARLFHAGMICAALLVILWGMALLLLGRPSALHQMSAALFPTLLAVSSAAFILALWTNRVPPLMQALLAWKPFVYLGKISYGLYVYHMFSFLIPHNAHGTKRTLLMAVALLATIIVASLSWFVLEKPINELKRFFPYPRTPKRREETVSV